MAVALNSVIFRLIGFKVRLAAMLQYWRTILIAYLAVTVGRAMLVFFSLAVTAPHARGDSMVVECRTHLGWTARRPVDCAGARATVRIPVRDLLVNMTFGVVLPFILIQGLTMGAVLRWLGLVTPKSELPSEGAT